MDGRIVKNPAIRRVVYIATFVVVAVAMVVNRETAESIGALAVQVSDLLDKAALVLAALTQLLAAVNVPQRVKGGIEGAD